VHMIEKYCEECEALGIKTVSERYRKISLRLCSLHYWLKRARNVGFSLEEYISRSRKFMFSTSLPDEESIKRIMGNS